MGKRVYIFFTIMVLNSIALLLGHFYIDNYSHGYLLGLVIYIYAIIYFLFGLPRLITYLIYAVFIVPILIFIQRYQLLIISIFTIIIVLNPLSFLEAYLDKTLSKGQVEMYGFIPKGKYETFFKYHQSMKEHFHLPQMEKLYKKPQYQFFRTFFVIALFALLVFLLIFSANDIIGGGLTIMNLLTIYLSAVLTIGIMILYKRGFTSMFRIFKILSFPPVIMTIAYYFRSLLALQIVLLIITSLAMIGIFINEFISYLSRVVYEAYEYLDLNKNEKVFANALYEPFIYEEIDKHTHLIKFKINEKEFNKEFKRLLAYTNIHKVIITAYLFKDDEVNIYTESYNIKSIEKIEKRIISTYQKEITVEQITDENYYEKKFLHNHDYIVTRAKSLAYLLKTLDIKDNIIISTAIHFKDEAHAKTIIDKYSVRINDNKNSYVLLEVYLKVPNDDFIIESTVRDLLLDMLISGGTFVRIMVYY